MSRRRNKNRMKAPNRADPTHRFAETLSDRVQIVSCHISVT